MKDALRPRLPAHAREHVGTFIREHVALSGTEGVVVGLSGGVDSALVATLAVEALGPGRVVGLSLPDARAPPALREEVRAFAQGLGVRFRETPIAPVEDAVIASLGAGSPGMVLRGNVKARVRMILLYSEALASRLLVTGTGNKSEILLGYFTKYGDGGVDLLPIGDLYKTSVYDLGREVGLPGEVLTRAPTAGLWEGQTDEAELGFTYDFADRVLLGMEHLLPPGEIARKLEVPPGSVEAVAARVGRFRHKRRLPPIAKLSRRTVGVDWRD